MDSKVKNVFNIYPSTKTFFIHKATDRANLKRLAFKNWQKLTKFLEEDCPVENREHGRSNESSKLIAPI